MGLDVRRRNRFGWGVWTSFKHTRRSDKKIFLEKKIYRTRLTGLGMLSHELLFYSLLFWLAVFAIFYRVEDEEVIISIRPSRAQPPEVFEK